jgi:hypothetical protein
MSIKDLLAVVRPPKKPIDSKGDWNSVHLALWMDYRYMQFPADFRDFIARYGSGRLFGGELEVYNPLTEYGMRDIQRTLDELRIMRGGLYPLPLEVHPTSPGLLPWGHDSNGNTYGWLTAVPKRHVPSECDKWPVVLVAHGWAQKPKQFRADVTTFLAGFANNKYPAVLGGADPLPKEARVSTPGRTQSECARNLKKR